MHIFFGFIAIKIHMYLNILSYYIHKNICECSLCVSDVCLCPCVRVMSACPRQATQMGCAEFKSGD